MRTPNPFARACVDAAPQDNWNCPACGPLAAWQPPTQSHVTYLPATRSISCTSVSLSRTLPLSSPRLIRVRLRVRVRVMANLALTLLGGRIPTLRPMCSCEAFFFWLLIFVSATGRILQPAACNSFRMRRNNAATACWSPSLAGGVAPEKGKHDSQPSLATVSNGA